MEWDELIRIWIIVCPLVFLGGLIDAVAGGGGLITLPAYLLAGLPPHLASGTNKCGNFFGTLIATGRFLKRGDVHLPSALAGGAGALVGAWLGARLNMIMPEQALYYLMLAVLHVLGTPPAFVLSQDQNVLHELLSSTVRHESDAALPTFHCDEYPLSLLQTACL